MLYCTFTFQVFKMLRFFFLNCTGKSQAVYETMIQAVIDACERLGVSADPTSVTTDFESAAMNAIRSKFGSSVAVHGCFFHLCQSTYRKIQALGLTQAYNDTADSSIKEFCSMLDALAFLPEADVQTGMDFIRQSVPSGQHTDKLMDLVAYFDSTYISGGVRRVQRPSNNGLSVRLRRLAPLFPPATWNVFASTLSGNHRTNNVCEAWNRGFNALVGHCHPAFYCAVEALQQDSAAATTVLLQNARGQPPVKRQKRSTVRLQRQLQTICGDRRDGRKSVGDTLRAVAHTVRLI